jgi:hypothetical protein
MYGKNNNKDFVQKIFKNLQTKNFKILT